MAPRRAARPRYFKKIFALFLAAALAPAAAVSLLFTSVAGAAIGNEAQARLEAQAASFAAAAAGLADSCARELSTLAEDPVLRAALSAEKGPDAGETAKAYRAVAARFSSRDSPAEASALSDDGSVALAAGSLPPDRDMAIYGTWGIFRELATDDVAAYPRPSALSDGTQGSFTVGVRVRDEGGAPIGYALADVRRAALARIATSSGLPGSALLAFPSGKIVFDRSDPSNEGSFVDTARPARRGMASASAVGAGQRFIVVAEAPEGFYDSFGRAARTIALAGLAGATALAAALALKASSSVTEPVLSMADSMRLVEAGDLSIRIEPSGNDELGDLSRSFNAMTAELDSLMTREKERQELLREAELRALAAQMNPHFLHNTLASIKSLAKLGRADEIAEVVSRLGKLLRSGSGKREGPSTVGEGLGFVRDYLWIEKVRFGERFAFSIDVDPAIEGLYLPPLSLEPLAENALTHGLERKRGKGTLAVNGRLEGPDAVVEFVDDGPGMDPDELERLQADLESGRAPERGVGMGLLGTNRRLVLEFGRGYGLRASLGDGHSGSRGFRVELRIPAGAQP